jgi:hypothetical protein
VCNRDSNDEIIQTILKMKDCLLGCAIFLLGVERMRGPQKQPVKVSTRFGDDKTLNKIGRLSKHTHRR